MNLSKNKKLTDCELKYFNDSKNLLLEIIVDYFDTFNIPYWLEGGALLGIYRDGNLIEKDNDIDISMKVESINDSFFSMLDAIKKDKRLILKRRGAHISEYKNAYDRKSIAPLKGYIRIDLILQDTKVPINCDIFIWYPYKDIHFMVENQTFRVHSKDIVKFQKIQYNNLRISIPLNIEQYLDTVFTPNWRKPIALTGKRWNSYRENFWCRWTTWQSELPDDYTYNWN